MATYTVRNSGNPVKKPKDPRKPRPVEPVGGGQVGMVSGMGSGIDR